MNAPCWAAVLAGAVTVGVALYGGLLVSLAVGWIRLPRPLRWGLGGIGGLVLLANALRILRDGP